MSIGCVHYSSREAAEQSRKALSKRDGIIYEVHKLHTGDLYQIRLMGKGVFDRKINELIEEFNNIEDAVACFTSPRLHYCDPKYVRNKDGGWVDQDRDPDLPYCELSSNGLYYRIYSVSLRRHNA